MNRTARIAGFLLTLAALSTSHAQSPLDSSACTEPLGPAEVAALATAFRPMAQRLARPVRFFHWAWRGPVSTVGPYKEISVEARRTMGLDEAIDLPDPRTGLYRGPVPLSDPAYAAYFRSMTGQFSATGTDHRSWNLGAALYTAVDPVSSANFSGDPGFLLEIEAPAGAVYLDFRSGFSIERGSPATVPVAHALSPRTFERLLACNAGWDPHWLRELQAAQLNPSREIGLQGLLRTPFMRGAIVAAMRTMHVSFFVDNWVPSPFPACRNAESSASSRARSSAGNSAVFMDPAALERGVQLRGFVRELEATPERTKATAYADLLAHLRAFRLQEVFTDRTHLAAALQRMTSDWQSVIGTSAAPVPAARPAQLFGCSKQAEYLGEANPVRLRPAAIPTPLRD